MGEVGVPAMNDAESWQQYQSMWDIRSDTIYLNHGSFGPPPQTVREARGEWQRRLDSQPMDFFDRQYETVWRQTRQRLAALVGVAAEDLLLVGNATDGMNLVADNLRLAPGDQVALNNHEYGAVQRIWQRACARAGADPPVMATLPDCIESKQQIVDAVMSVVNDRTRLLVVSHITSPSALIMPVREICQAAHARGVAVCVDGPHAPAQLDLNIDALGCDFYTASCHKWLCAPFGSGFMTVAREYQADFQPSLLSWGRLLPARPEQWWEEFIWTGTRDPSAYFGITAAIDFLHQVGWENFRQRTHALARYARDRIAELTGILSPVPDSTEWYGSMGLAPLPAVDARHLQTGLWREFGIEVPIVQLAERQFARVSCHLYNTPSQIDRLVAGLRQLM
jgi:isopenicillin-N epimerase